MLVGRMGLAEVIPCSYSAVRCDGTADTRMLRIYVMFFYVELHFITDIQISMTAPGAAGDCYSDSPFQLHIIPGSTRGDPRPAIRGRLSGG
jgi:hypothetical protein